MWSERRRLMLAFWMAGQGGGKERERLRNEKDRGVCLGGYGQTIRRRRWWGGGIGAVAAGLRARQDYLPPGKHSRFLFRERDIRTTLQGK